MSTILDAKGRPVRSAELAGDPQTSRLGHLYREYSNHPSRGLTPAKLASILQEAEEGSIVAQCELAEDMEEKDTQIMSDLRKRKMAVQGVAWTVDAPADASAAEKKDAARIKEILQDLDMEDVFFDMADAILKGFACLEIDWDREGGEWRPRSVAYRPAEWFMAKPEDRNTLLLRTADGQGEALRPYGWVLHEHRAKSGYLVRGGLARVLAWPYLFRNYSIRDMAEFLEIYGLPLRLGKYPQNASAEEKRTLLTAVVGIGHAAAGIVPKEMDIEFEKAADGASDPFMAMVDWAEKSISKAILGATLTTQTDGGGAYALGEIHNEVRHEILISDLRQIAQTITRDLVRPLAHLNTSMTRMPRFMFLDEKPEDVKLYGELVEKLVSGTNMRISKKWAHKTLRIPEADGDEDVLEAKEPTPFTARERETVIRATEQPPRGDLIDDQVARLEADTAVHIAALTGRVEELLNEAGSMEEFRDRLLEIYPELDAEGIASLMGQALTAAHLAGRADILEDQ